MRFQAPESLAEQIAQHLGRLIMVGTLKPLERIQELKVASELDVSRGSVREALLILERRHLIDIYPRKGAVVSDLSPHQVASLYDMFAVLLTMLASKVATSWEEADLKPITDQIQKINGIILTKEASIESVVDNSFELMDMCMGFCNNPYLQEIMENLRPSISRTYYLAMRSRRDELMQSLHFYDGLLKSVKARDLSGLKLVIDSFAEHQKDLVLSVLEDRSAA
ncbi:GntR family transcriptional regulator [Hahella sp. CCB-MM4]|uniref:GntR family transcriptional regulator n=1 Tax=Hahella sp. (strain CCB-MM4) TaxID=1926491 RepID=UPI000B9A7DC7|nr:GntR family transcriptional regulator [Hahella sp. CCB-MM4]OZG71240.1 GntR family transcriptional regulator [Hahella sp. CCB-MM4]